MGHFLEMPLIKANMSCALWESVIRPHTNTEIRMNIIPILRVRKPSSRESCVQGYTARNWGNRNSNKVGPRPASCTLALCLPVLPIPAANRLPRFSTSQFPVPLVETEYPPSYSEALCVASGTQPAELSSGR